MQHMKKRNVNTHYIYRYNTRDTLTRINIHERDTLTIIHLKKQSLPSLLKQKPPLRISLQRPQREIMKQMTRK